MSNATKIFESWRRYLGEAPFAPTSRANVRGEPMRATQVATKIKDPIKQITQKNQLPALRTKGELTAPQREKVVNALVRTAQQYAVPLDKSLIKAEDDIIDVILSVMEKLCVVQKMNPMQWQNLSKQARVKMEPLKQNPEELIKFFEGVANAIKDQGGIDVDCDQITTQNNKQITQRESNEKIRSKKSN